MKWITCFILFISSLCLSAQTTQKIELLQEMYDSLFQVNKRVINGRLHNGIYPGGTGHPFFGESGWREGAIHIGGKIIPYHAIRYDLVNDDLLIQHFTVTGSNIIIVNKYSAGEFIIDGHRFILFDNKLISGNGNDPGYFESVYRSETELWIKWKKYFADNSGSGEYKQSRTRYIKVGKNYYRITNRRSLLKAFAGHEEEIKGYMRDQKIYVRSITDDQIVGLLKYYEENLMSSKE